MTRIVNNRFFSKNLILYVKIELVMHKKITGTYAIFIKLKRQDFLIVCSRCNHYGSSLITISKDDSENNDGKCLPNTAKIEGIIK